MNNMIPDDKVPNKCQAICCSGVAVILCKNDITFMTIKQIDGLVHKRHNSIANTLELHLSCTYPSKCCCIVLIWQPPVFYVIGGELVFSQQCHSMQCTLGSHWIWLCISCLPVYCIPRSGLLMGILQNMVNPSLAPTQPEGSELPTFSYGGEGISRVLKQYCFFSAWIYFPNTVK